MTKRAPWGLCAWIVGSMAGCAAEAPSSAPPRAERSQTLRAKVPGAESALGGAGEQPGAACGAGEEALEAFASDAPAGRAAFLLQREDHKFGLPLQSASYDSFVVGTVVETIVKQRYLNPLQHAIEAVYVFPLPNDGAVFEYSMRVQDRAIRGQMKRRAEARALYAQAKQAGHTAGLFEQERPNVFTQSVANIPPGETIEVELRVVQPLRRQDGRYRLVLPTVVGPRYVPGVAKAPVPPGSFAPDTDRVPDGSRITPMPQLGRPPPANVSITVVIEDGARVDDVRSKHHDVELYDEDGAAHVTLTAGTTIADRDFELSWSASGEQPHATLMLQPDADTDAGHFTLTLEPPRALPSAHALPRELVFVVDTSGSMDGPPIETAKRAMRQVLERLAPSDVFQIVQFSQRASSLGSGFMENTRRSVRHGLAFVDAMRGSGGTEMLAGVHAALELPRDPRRLRMVLFLTDGYIGNESEVFRAVRERIGDARLFSLGVGSSVNRHLLDGLARMGRGDVSYVSSGESPDDVVDRFFERIERPALTELAIDWGGLVVEDVEPQRLPDLFAGQPVVVFGRYRGAPRGEIALRGRRGDRIEQVAVGVDFTRPNASSAALSAMWARARIARWSDELIERRPEADVPAIEEAITQLALAHHVLTQYTAFVAVDDTRVVPPATRTMHVAPALPSGVRARNVFGAAAPTQGDGATGMGLTVTIGSGALAGLGAGYGTGGGGGFRGRSAIAPHVRAGKADVRGALPKEIIRRIVQRHLNEVRFCYEQALHTRPDLRGRVRVKFVISPIGAVHTAAVADSTLTDAKAESCIATAVRRWVFLAPEGGGIVVVTLPFELGPAP